MASQYTTNSKNLTGVYSVESVEFDFLLWVWSVGDRKIIYVMH